MATQLQMRRGTASQNSSFTGAVGEVSVNTTNDSLHIHDGSTAGGFELARVDGSNWAITNAISTTANISFGDNDKAIFGASSDLQIYHDGSNSYVNDVGTGDLILKTAGAGVQMWGGGDVMFNAVKDGGVSLYYDSAAKLATTSTGIDVTGSVVSDGAVIQGTGSQALTVSSSTGNSVASFTSTDSQAYISYLDDATTGVNYVATGAQGNDLVLLSGAGIRSKLFANGDFQLYEDTASTPKFFWDASAESLGIGTSSPSTLLHVKSTGSATATIEAGGGGDAILDIKAAEASGGESILRFSDSVSGVGFITYAQNDGGSDFMRFGTASTERMRIDSSGNVGIGTSSPNSTAGFTTVTLNNATSGGIIDFENNTSLVGRIYNTSTNFHVYNQTANSLLFGTSGTERMRIDSSGNVGIGTSSPTDTLSVGTLGSGSNSIITIGASTTGTSSIYFGDGASAARFRGYFDYVHSSDHLAIGTAGTERMRIDSSGRVGINNSTIGDSQLAVTNGNAGSFAGTFANTNASGFGISIGSDSGILAYFYANGARSGSPVGSITENNTSTSYNTSSDQRLKENIADADDAGSKVDAIQVRKFDWKADGSHQDYGMVAQELVTVAPEAVSAPEDPEEMMGVDYSKLVPMLVKEIQSLRNRVAQLENN